MSEVISKCCPTCGEPLKFTGFTKKCIKCQETKPAAKFRRNKRTGDNRSSYCLECIGAAAGDDEKYCGPCDEMHSRSSFGPDKNKPDRLCSQCLEFAKLEREKPENKARKAAWEAIPENRARRTDLRATPENRARRATYDALPENKVRRAALSSLSKKRDRALRPAYHSARRALERVQKDYPGRIPAGTNIGKLIASTIRFYAEAQRLTKEKGVLYHVDHEIELQDGGLHNPGNLQAIPATENYDKSTRAHNARQPIDY